MKAPGNLTVFKLMTSELSALFQHQSGFVAVSELPLRISTAVRADGAGREIGLFAVRANFPDHCVALFL
jgi:hypothetical protein